MLRHTLWIALAGLALCACSDTHKVDLDVCGNRIVEKKEDCDGQAGCSADCHFKCSKTDECPGGWGCDLAASICRAPVGDFEKPVTVGEAFGPPIVRDFDGDKRDDLVLTGAQYRPVPASLLYFDATGQIDRRVTLPSAASGSAADVTLDGLPDLILSGGTVTALQAEQSRRLTPLMGAVRDVARDAQLFSLDVDCLGGRDFVLFEGNSLTDVSAPEPFSLGQIQLSSGALEQLEKSSSTRGLRTLHAVGRLSNGEFGSCEMIALPSSSSTIAIYAPVQGELGAFTLQLLSTVSHSVRGAGRLFLADLNLDGNDDLIVSGQTTDVAYGFGDGTFSSQPPSTPPLQGDGGTNGAGGSDPAGGATTPDQQAFEYSETPTVAVVEDFGIPQLYSSDQGYTDARSLDMSGDGVADLVGVSSSRSIVVERSHPSSATSPLTLSTSGTPRLEDVGDFDGDGNDDLLVLEDIAGPNQLISVLFSPATYTSGGPTILSELSGVRQLAAASVIPPGGVDPDANADIAVLYDVEGATKLGLLLGGADRLLRSDVPGPPNDTSFMQPLAVLGRFHAAGMNDLALLDTTLSIQQTTGGSEFGSGGDSGIGVDPGRGLGGDSGIGEDPGFGFGGDVGFGDVPNFEDLPKEMRLLLRSIGPTGTNNLETEPNLGDYVPYEAVAADLDLDKVDELYVRVRDGVLAIRQGTPHFAATRVLTTTALSIALGRADTDRDGSPDVFAIEGNSDTLVVLQATNQGPKERRLAFGGCPGKMIAAAFIQADADPELEVMINCGEVEEAVDEKIAFLPHFSFLTVKSTSGLYLSDVDWEHERLNVLRQFDGLFSLHLETGDFDGNGLQDLAADGSEAAIMFGKVPSPP